MDGAAESAAPGQEWVSIEPCRLNRGVVNGNEETGALRSGSAGSPQPGSSVLRRVARWRTRRLGQMPGSELDDGEES